MGEDFNKRISTLEVELAELQRAFEQYFLGVERISPEGQRDAMRKRLQRLRTDARNSSTVVKFRLGTVWNRFISFEQMWNKTLRQIEDGTYHRDRKRAQRRKLKREAEQASSEAPARAAPTPRPSAAGSAALSDDQIRRIYDTYVLARRRTGEPSRVSIDSLAGQLRKRVSTMVEKHQCRGVEFKVVIKGGKALIKAQPKKEP